MTPPMKSAKAKSAQANIKVKVKRLPHAEGLPLPAYQTPQSAGMDLLAAVPEGKGVKLKPLARALIPTGLAIELPAGTEAQVRPRSGLAIKNGITVLNSPGTVDADYRGEVSVILINLGNAPVTISRGDRIAQMIIAPVVQAALSEQKDLSQTARGAGGFGSTGKTTAEPDQKRSKKNPAPRPTRKKRPAAKISKKSPKRSAPKR